MATLTKVETLKTDVHVTDDREARPFRWYAARTQMNCETKALASFAGKIKDSYLPVQEEIHQWSDRKKKIQRIVIPTIVFVKMTESQARKFYRTTYCYGLMKNPGSSVPTYIPEEQINALKFMLYNSDDPVTIETTPPKLGDRVVVTRGKLQGLEGHVVESKQGETYIVVLLNIIGCAKVKIDIIDTQVITTKEKR
jgi:transcription antitermination factor NusG